MIKITGSEVAKLTNDLHLMTLQADKKFTWQEAKNIILAIELISMMYYHAPNTIEKDAQ